VNAGRLHREAVGPMWWISEVTQPARMSERHRQCTEVMTTCISSSH